MSGNATLINRNPSTVHETLISGIQNTRADELRALLHEEQAATEQDFSPRSLLVTVVLCLLAAAAGFAAHAWLFAPAAATTTN